MEESLYEYSVEKNIKLWNERGVTFEDVIAILDSRGALGVIDHPNKAKYPRQKIYIIEIDAYLYLVPFEKKDNKAILKTIYPSRKMTKIYRDKLSKEIDHD